MPIRVRSAVPPVVWLGAQDVQSKYRETEATSRTPGHAQSSCPDETTFRRAILIRPVHQHYFQLGYPKLRPASVILARERLVAASLGECIGGKLKEVIGPERNGSARHAMTRAVLARTSVDVTGLSHTRSDHAQRLLVTNLSSFLGQSQASAAGDSSTARPSMRGSASHAGESTVSSMDKDDHHG